jgi:other hect domain ubiquitin protein ligase E3
MTPIKIELSTKIMHKSAIARDNVPKVQLERLKFNKEKEKKEVNPKETVTNKNRDEFVFTRAYEQLKNVSTTLFRPVKPTGSDPFLAFEVVFKGELVMGEGGPYRQFFADISQELQPSNVSLSSQHKNLNLLVPSPNNSAKFGEGRDKFVINPSAKESYQLALYEFLGILMGCSVRTGTHLTLDLPTLFWKQLSNQNITIEDLEEVDKPLTDLIRFMSGCTKEVFDEKFFENYTTILSDRSVVELIPGGAKIKVKFEDRFDYIQKLLDCRLNESKI